MSIEISIGGQKGWRHYGNVDSGFFHTFDELDIGGKPRKVQIFLPTEHDSSSQRYPVIYMNDGQTVFHSGGLSPWSLEADKTVDSFLKKNKICKVIIVAIYPINRTDEYLSIKTLPGDKNSPVGKGELSSYANYLALILKPFIDRNYKTDPSAERTAIIGSAFGGIAALYTAIKHPDKFGIAGVMSPSINVAFEVSGNSKIEKSALYGELSDYLITKPCRPKLWIDWGVFEPPIAECVPKLISLLQKNFDYTQGKNIYTMEDALGTHDERAWHYRFGLILSNFYSI